MVYDNTNDLYDKLVCEDPVGFLSNETTEDDPIHLIMCIDTSGWNPGLTVIDEFEITNK